VLALFLALFFKLMADLDDGTVLAVFKQVADLDDGTVLAVFKVIGFPAAAAGGAAES
jgi:hypothetical protein